MTKLWAAPFALALVVGSVPADAHATTSPAAVARTQAAAALAGIRLTDATRLNRRPTDLGAGPGANYYPTSAVVTRLYAVAGDVGATLAQVKAHAPAGWLLRDDTETGSPQVLVFVPVAGGPPSPSTVMVTAAQAGSRVDVEVVADVLWLPLRTPLESPATPAAATVAYTGPVPAAYLGPGIKRAHRHLTLHGSQLGDLAKALNQTPVSLPYVGPVLCAADFGERAAATLRYGGHRVVFAIAIAGCPTITVTADGVRQPSLDPSLALYHELTRLLNRTIPWTQR